GRKTNVSRVVERYAGRALGLVQAEVIGTERGSSAVEAAGVMGRHVGFELAWPRQDIRLIGPVFDDPSELGVVRAPAAGLPHTGKSKLTPPTLPSPASGGGNGAFVSGDL